MSRKPISHESISGALSNCGVALLRGVFEPSVIHGLLESYLHLAPDLMERLRPAGKLMGGRIETLLPFSEPFSSFDILGPNGELWPPLSAVLGKNFSLFYFTVIAVPPGSAMQQPHNDSISLGSVTVHIPLQELVEETAPVSLCSETHLQQGCQHKIVFKNAFTKAAMQRVCDTCRWRQIEFCAKPGPQLQVKTRPGQFGTAISGFSSPDAEALDWRVGDEILAVNGQFVNGDSDLLDYVASTGSIKCPPNEDHFHVCVLRPRALRSVPKLMVAAPLSAGDALLYDSQTVHWGTANRANKTRYVLYAGFMNSSVAQGGHGWGEAPDEAQSASLAFRRRHDALLEQWGRRWARHGDKSSDEAVQRLHAKHDGSIEL